MPVKPIMHTGEQRGECYNNLGTLTARINDLRIIESFQQTRNIIWRSQLQLLFLRQDVTKSLQKIVCSLAISPGDEKTKGVTDVLSTSQTLSIASRLLTFMLLVESTCDLAPCLCSSGQRRVQASMHGQVSYLVSWILYTRQRSHTITDTPLQCGVYMQTPHYGGVSVMV